MGVCFVVTQLLSLKVEANHYHASQRRALLKEQQLFFELEQVALQGQLQTQPFDQRRVRYKKKCAYVFDDEGAVYLFRPGACSAEL